MRIIDIHAHIYPDAIAGRAVDAIGSFYHFPMEMDGTVDTLLAQSAQAGISLSCTHSAAVTPTHVEHINTFLMEAAAAHPDRLLPCGTMHPDFPNVADELDRIQALGARAVKLHPDFQRFCLDGEKALSMFAAIAQRDLAAIVHVGDTRYPYSQPARMARVLRRVPRLKAVCAHLGGWSEWTEGWRDLSQLPNAWVDTSSSLYALSPETAVEIIRRYGAHRALFGTDYPMWTPQGELERFMRLPLTNQERERILHGSAEELFALE